MITSVKIKDNTKTPFEYVSDIEAFENGREFIFKPGVNVIIGKNGSGKSTLLNIISMYALCEKSMCSEIPIEALDFPPIFDDDDDDDKVLDGIDISSDYAGKVFRLLPSAEMNQDGVLKNISNLDLYVNNIRRSYGEKVVLSLESLFNLMFGQKDYTFPIQDLVEYKKKSNAFWIKRIDNLLKYYERNRITLTESSFEYTVLMDEPDRNLDIDNIMQIYNVLSFHKPQTQIIAIVHNPALIYKLSKLDCVNFIEMTEGYLKDVVNFISETNMKIIGSRDRHVFTATFIRFGFRDGYKGPVKTILLQDVLLDGKIVTDHLWFDLTKGFESADLLPGDVVEFCARVSIYEKGYKGYRNDVFDRPIEKDYRLSRPTKIKKIGKKSID